MSKFLKQLLNIMKYVFLFTIIVFFTYIQVDKARCRAKGWASADITSCYDQVGDKRIRTKN